MHTTCAYDHAANEWRIRVAETFDVEEAKACIQRFRGFTERRLRRLVFDLNKTQHLHTAGLGAMLFIRSCCEVPNEDAHIVYTSAHVGMILKLANLDRWFILLPSEETMLLDRTSSRLAGRKVSVSNRAHAS